MARRHMNNLGTGIQWSYRNALDNGWRQNKITGRWFKDDVEPYLGPEPTPYTAKSLNRVRCHYFNVIGGKCQLWNSGFQHCCGFKCKYHNPEKRNTHSNTTCLRCAYYYQNKCRHDDAITETNLLMAQYCCYYQSEENQSTIYERIRSQVITKHSTHPTTDFYWLMMGRKVCPYDKNDLKYQLVSVKRTNGTTAQLNMLVCDCCKKKFIIKSNTPKNIGKFFLTAHEIW